MRSDVNKLTDLKRVLNIVVTCKAKPELSIELAKYSKTGCKDVPIAIGDGYAVLTLKSANDVELPQDIAVRLAEWMDMYLGLHSYSCAGFLYYMMTGKPYPPPRSWETFSSGQRTHYLLLTEKNPRSPLGDHHKSVLQNFHFAMYIPELHLYLSQFGNGGEIVSCGLEEMHKFFKTDKVTYIDSMKPRYTH